MTQVTVQVAGRGTDPVARCEINAGTRASLSPDGTASVQSFGVGVDMGAVHYLTVARQREGEIKIRADGPVTVEVDGKQSKMKAGRTKKLAGGAQRAIVRAALK